MSSSTSGPFDVFISFRGEDTRGTIVSHLYTYLIKKGISTFKDKPGLKLGDGIPETLKGVIMKSRFAVVVISRNFANSSWCLNELRLIMRRHAKKKIEVIPIFFGVNPSDVRHLRGRFDLNFYQKHNPKMIPKWSEMLVNIANLSGKDSRICFNSDSDNQSEIVQDIVGRISSRLVSMLPIEVTFIAGLEEYEEGLKPLYEMESNKVRMIGICGMGGIGKTTIADYLYQQHKQEFSNYHCYMENVGKLSRLPDGIFYLQNKLISNLIDEVSVKLGNKKEGASYIQTRLAKLKVLIVLDNVDHESQLDYLAKEANWFGPGSLIIITTRDKGLLKSSGVTFVYDVKCLDDERSLQLFKYTAFEGKDPPSPRHDDLSNRIYKLAHGLPLALKVFGSKLNEKSIDKWEDALKSFKETLHNDIKSLLEISYERLDDQSKSAFLHIACLFNGDPVKRVKALLVYGVITIGDLADKSLIQESTDGYISMHPLIEQMGKQIVHQGRLSERRILCRPKDIYPLVEDRSGTLISEGVSVNVGKMGKGFNIRWKLFRQMHDLIFLKIYNNNNSESCGEDLNPKGDPEGDLYVPISLRLLHWDNYPFTALPSRILPNSIVELNMCNSKLTTLWSGTPEFLYLRRMDLTGSKDLKYLPDLQEAEYLEELILEGCSALEEIPQSICNLSRLQKVDVSNCDGLRDLTIMIKNSETMVFQSKSLHLRSVQLAFRDAKPSQDISLTNLSIKGKLKITFQVLKGYAEHLCFVSDQLMMLEQQTPDLMTPPRPPPFSCKSLDIMRFECNMRRVPFDCFSFSGFPWLMDLNLINLNIQKIPDNIHEMVALEKLDLSGNGFIELPTTMSRLLKLKHLTLCNCRKLEKLPKLYQLEKLTLSDCTKLKTLVTPLDKPRFRLLELWLDNCKNVENLSDQLTRFQKLRYLDISRHDFKTVPKSVNKLPSLLTLCLNYCKNLKSVTELPQSLKCLKAHGCNSLQIPSSSTVYQSVNHLDLSPCSSPKQNQIQITRFPAGTHGEEVTICDCFKKTIITKEETGWSEILAVWQHVSPWFWCFVIGTIVVSLHNILRMTGIEPFTLSTSTTIFHIYLCTFLFAIFLHYKLQSISMRLAERRKKTKRKLFYFFFSFLFLKKFV